MKICYFFRDTFKKFIILSIITDTLQHVHSFILFLFTSFNIFKLKWNKLIRWKMKGKSTRFLPRMSVACPHRH